MRFVKLSDGCHVNPAEVQEITINERRDAVTVRMKDGIGHHIECDYYKSIYDTLERVKSDIERDSSGNVERDIQEAILACKSTADFLAVQKTVQAIRDHEDKS